MNSKNLNLLNKLIDKNKKKEKKGVIKKFKKLFD